VVLQNRTDALQQSLWSNVEFLTGTDPHSLALDIMKDRGALP
jgi:hypothetical protein